MNNLMSTTALQGPNLGALADFRNFLYLVWKHLGLPEPTPIQYDIAEYLQRGPKRKVIEAFRGVGKSWITAAYVVWRLLVDPQVEILVVSASKDRSDQFSTFALRLIDELPCCAHLKPDPLTQRVSRVAFDVGPHKASHSPSVKSVGITGQLTGSRADEVVLDDVEVPNNSATQTQRDVLSERIKEADAVVKPGGKITYLGTPQTFESIYNQLAARGYEIRIWPARVPDAARVTAYGSRLAPYVAKLLEEGATVGTTTDPRRFSDADLAERELSYGASGFALQFMLDTTLSDANRYPLKQRDLVVMDLDPDTGPLRVVWGTGGTLVHRDLPNFGFNGDLLHSPISVGEEGENGLKFAPYTGSVMFIDPSGRGKDETAFAVVKILHGQLFLMELRGLTGGYDDKTLEVIGKAAARHEVNHILVESNFGDGMFLKLLQPVLARCGWTGSLTEERSSGQKELRIIDTLEPVMGRHKLIFSREVIEADYESAKGMERERGESASSYSLMYQLTHITRARRSLRHDDRLEALAGAVRYWVSQMARDQDKALEDHKAAEMKREVARYLKSSKDLGLTGGSPQPRRLGTFARGRDMR